MTTGLEATADPFAPAREPFGRVYRAAHELGNPDGRSGAGVHGRWDGVVRGMDRLAAGRTDRAGPLRHVVKVSRSYEPGPFPTDDVADLPRTSDDLGQPFGSHRHHERRCRGRTVASPGLVARGSVRLAAGRMTRLGEATADALAPTDVLARQELRAEVGYREAARVQHRRFRRDPAAYLKRLENQARQSGLPA